MYFSTSAHRGSVITNKACVRVNPCKRSRPARYIAVFFAFLPITGFFVRYAEAECPPVVSPGGELQSLLNQCEKWMININYDPAEGFLPEEHPEHPWTPHLEEGATAELVDGKLVISGTGASTAENNFYKIEVPWLDNLENTIYLLQIRARFDEMLPDSDYKVAVAGIHDGIRFPGYSLQNYLSDRVAVLSDFNAAPPSGVWMEWDYGHETTYTLLVERGEKVHLAVDDEPVMSLPYEELRTERPQTGFSLFVSGNVIAEYSFVQLCACSAGDPILPPVLYKGEPVDRTRSIGLLVGSEEKLAVENLMDGPDPFEPPDENELSMIVRPLALPGRPSGQFEFKARGGRIH